MIDDPKVRGEGKEKPPRFPPNNIAVAAERIGLALDEVTTGLQPVVPKLGEPWYRRRALRVFLDDTSLSAKPHLWPSIEQALALRQMRPTPNIARRGAEASYLGSAGYFAIAKRGRNWSLVS
jgi:hypothetical protein